MFPTNAQLITLLIRSDETDECARQFADKILTTYPTLHALMQTSPAELQNSIGLSQEQADRLTAALELGRRLSVFDQQARPTIYQTQDAARLLADMQYLKHEEVRVILLNNNREVLDIHTIYQGTLNATLIRVSEVFRVPMLQNVPGIILAHNHPSGDPSPSPEDLDLTNRLIAAGRLLDIMLIDHLIIGGQGWLSLRDMGFRFPA